MKKTIALILSLTLVTGAFSGCSNTTTPAESSKEELITISSINTSSTASTDSSEKMVTTKVIIKESDLPTPDAEQQKILDTYVNPYDISGLFFISFSSEDPSEINSSVLSAMFTLLIYNLGNPEGFPTDSELQANNFQIPASIFEGVLEEHFNLTTNEIQTICVDIYNKETDSYPLAEGLGGGPTEFVITDHKEKGNFLTFSYEFYNVADTPTLEDETTLYFQLQQTGTMVIDTSNGTFKFISNTVKPAV